MAETDPFQELREALAKATAESSTHARLEVQRLSALAAPALLAKLAEVEERVAELRTAFAAVSNVREDLKAENARLREGVQEALAALLPVRIANVIVNDVWKRLAALASSVQPSPASDAQGPGVDGWRPMESAPKDGTRVLLACSRWAPARLIVIADWNPTGKPWKGEIPFSDDDGNIYPDAVAWMPLPAPPSTPKITKPPQDVRDFVADLPAPPAVSEPSTATGGE